MPSLIGNKPNQVPTNGDLGTMAFREQSQFYQKTEADALLANKQNASTTLTTYASTGVGFRNRIINGAMVIDQRYTGTATVPSSGGYTLDRWRFSENTAGAISIQQLSDAPSGFSNSLRVTTTTADSSLDATDYCYIEQRIEGYNFFDLGFGTASAQSVTLSFHVKSSLTGTFGGVLMNSAQNRCYPFTYTINAANTWEAKSVTVAGDTTGTWVGATNGIGIRVIFGLGVGSTYSGTAGAWAAAELYSPTGAVSLINTLNATWQITGVQLEAGANASPFERRECGCELAMCQRYYEKSYNINVFPSTNTTIGIHNVSGSSDASFNVITRVSFAVSKRASPSVTLYTAGGTSGSWGYNRNGASGTSTATADQIGMSGLRVYVDIGVAWVVGNIDGHWTASAEL